MQARDESSFSATNRLVKLSVTFCDSSAGETRHHDQHQIPGNINIVYMRTLRLQNGVMRDHSLVIVDCYLLEDFSSPKKKTVLSFTPPWRNLNLMKG